MSTVTQQLQINSTTTGFASPAESYVDKRLDLNELVIKDPLTTFYFRYGGEEVYGLNKGNILVIDRALEPKEGDLVILTEESSFKIRPYKQQKNLWGKIVWILKKM